MQTFVQFMEQRDHAKTYRNDQLTVLALYAEYVAWLARQPLENNAAAGKFSASALLVQLELINQYQIYILNLHINANRNQPIQLGAIPSYLTDPNPMNYLNKRPTEEDILIPREALPARVTTEINGQLTNIPASTERLNHTHKSMAIAVCIAGFALSLAGFAGLGLPLAVILIVQPLGFIGFNLARIFSEPMQERNVYDGKKLMITAMIGIIAIMDIITTGSVISHVFSVFCSIVVGTCVTSNIQLKMLSASKAKHEHEAILNTLDTIDRPTLPNTSLHQWKQPLVNQLQNPCEQPENKLEEAITATTHCLLASRFMEREEGTLSINELDQNLQKRLSA